MQRQRYNMWYKLVEVSVMALVIGLCGKIYTLVLHLHYLDLIRIMRRDIKLNTGIVTKIYCSYRKRKRMTQSYDQKTLFQQKIRKPMENKKKTPPKTLITQQLRTD